MALSSFPSIHNVLKYGLNIVTMEANDSVSPGMLVAFKATGADYKVVGCQGTEKSWGVGVALYAAKDGDKVAVALPPCIVKMAGNGTVNAGDLVYPAGNGNATGAVASVEADLYVDNTSYNVSADPVLRVLNYNVIGQAMTGGTDTQVDVLLNPFLWPRVNASDA